MTCASVCIHVANVKKLAASVRSDDSSISSLQEDERNKLRVSTVFVKEKSRQFMFLLYTC